MLRCKVTTIGCLVHSLMDHNKEWLQKRLIEYRAVGNDMGESKEEIEDMDKLGQGFTSVDPL